MKAYNNTILHFLHLHNILGHTYWEKLKNNFNQVKKTIKLMNNKVNQHKLFFFSWRLYWKEKNSDIKQ